MGREQNTRERFFTHIPLDTCEVDVPSSAGVPVSLTDELLNPLVEEIEIFFGVEVYATWASSPSEALTRLGSKLTRRKYKKCMIKSFFRRDDDKKLYVRSISAPSLSAIDKEIYYQAGC